MKQNRPAIPFDDEQESASFLDYLNILRRRKWVFLVVVVLVPLIAVAVSIRQAPTYEASAQVLLSESSLTDSLAGVQTANVDPARAAENEADLARVSQVVGMVIKAVPVQGMTSLDLLKSSSVSASLDSDFLTFSVTNEDPRLAQRLATAYARAFTQYDQALDTQSLRNTQSVAQRELAELAARGLSQSALYHSLSTEEHQLASLAALQSPTGVLVQPAFEATKTGPKTARNGALGLVLGVLLALLIVFLLEALDPRIRSIRSISRRLALQPLGSIPPPPRQLRRENRLVMMAAPATRGAESFRIVRANLDFANAEYQARTIMITSAGPGEGKSLTVANLAIALARAGRRVILADFDRRNPSLHEFFDLGDRPGLVDVELEHADLEDVLCSIALSGLEQAGANGYQLSRRQGRLEVLTTGQALQDPDEVEAQQTVDKVMTSLRTRADFVLIDAPPLMPVGDAIELSAHVDALLLVIQLNGLRRDALDELRRILWSSPAAKLGFVVTGAKDGSDGDHAYPYSTSKRKNTVSHMPATVRSSRPSDE